MKGGVEWKNKTKQSRVKDATLRVLVEDVQGLTEGKSRYVTACLHICKRFHGINAAPEIAKGSAQTQSY